MPLANRAQAEDESARSRGSPGLIGMRHDTRIEQRSRLEGVFVQEVRADESTLLLRETRMSGKGPFHLISARLEGREQIAVSPDKVFQDLRKEAGNARRIQCHDAIHDVVRARLVRRVEIARLGCWFEWPHNDARRIWAQVECLSVQKEVLCQGFSKPCRVSMDVVV